MIHALPYTDITTISRNPATSKMLSVSSISDDASILESSLPRLTSLQMFKITKTKSEVYVRYN